MPPNLPIVLQTSGMRKDAIEIGLLKLDTVSYEYGLGRHPMQNNLTLNEHIVRLPAQIKVLLMVFSVIGNKDSKMVLVLLYSKIKRLKLLSRN